MENLSIKVITDNFKKYFDAEWLANKIENGGYTNFQYGYKVAIDLETNEVWCMQNNEFSQNKNVEYFALPKYIPDYCELLDRAINWGEYSKNKTLKGFIKDQFKYSGHFCMNEDLVNDRDYFYLEEELLEIRKDLSITKIKLYRNNKVDGEFEITIDEIVRGYIQSEYYQDYIVAKGMPLYVTCNLNAGYEYLSDSDLLIDYYLDNRDRLVEELGITRNS